jgi:hypothetical protein
VFVCAFFFECQDCLLNVVLLFHGTCYLFQTSCCQIPSRRCIRLQFDYHFGTEDFDFQKGCPFGFFQNDSFFCAFFSGGNPVERNQSTYTMAICHHVTNQLQFVLSSNFTPNSMLCSIGCACANHVEITVNIEKSRNMAYGATHRYTNASSKAVPPNSPPADLLSTM